MRHKCFLILLPILSLSFLGSNNRLFEAYFTTNFSCIGSFEKGAEDYALSGKVKVKKTVLSLVEKMTVKTVDGLLIKTEVKKSHDVIKGSEYTLTFLLPFKSSLTERGLKVLIEFINPNSEVLHSFSFNIKPIERKTINPKLYINDYYVTDDIVVDPDQYSTNHSERIRFNETLDYFNVDNYYRLSLEDTFISYECGKSFPGCVAHLHFTDFLRIFPYLDNEKLVPYFDIPLRTIKKNNGVLFAFPSVMYVKPETLEMALEAKPGFKSTSYFYLPKNKCESLLDQEFSIVVSEFGYSKTSFTWNMRYTNNQRLIGDCSNSDYCVIGETVNG